MNKNYEQFLEGTSEIEEGAIAKKVGAVAIGMAAITGAAHTTTTNDAHDALRSQVMTHAHQMGNEPNKPVEGGPTEKLEIGRENA